MRDDRSVDWVRGRDLDLHDVQAVDPTRYDAKIESRSGDTSIEDGGLHIIGSERHESRRIDRQLRGRAGRQGDPGATQFFLSLEDDLMRLFATGAMNWVMDRALPDDVPIEAKMVTKAIERAQNTVEARNAETRKNVLKYDEVMNEQRKVIYKRRGQILDGADLREEALEYLQDAIEGAVATYCVSDIVEEWDLEGLATEISTLWPGEVSVLELGSCRTIDELEDVLWEKGGTIYEGREAELGTDVMRQVERQVMLRIIDQRWREHLKEMDLLREGIHLRAMGQRDPATEWQREGFDMFGQMMTGIAQDFVKYVMHVQVVVNEPAPAATDVQESGPQDPSGERAPAPAAQGLPTAPKETRQRAKQKPVVNRVEKIGRNDPCHCGSGKKFKQCHGKAG